MYGLHWETLVPPITAKIHLDQPHLPGNLGTKPAGVTRTLKWQA